MYEDLNRITLKAVYSNAHLPPIVLTRPQEVYQLLKSRMGDLAVESGIFLLLDGNWKLLGVYEAGVGSLYSVPHKPAEVIRHALMVGASSVIAVHNHPNGEMDTSQADIKTVKSMFELMKKLDITFRYSMVVTNKGYSFIHPATLVTEVPDLKET